MVGGGGIRSLFSEAIFFTNGSNKGQQRHYTCIVPCHDSSTTAATPTTTATTTTTEGMTVDRWRHEFVCIFSPLTNLCRWGPGMIGLALQPSRRTLLADRRSAAAPKS